MTTTTHEFGTNLHGKSLYRDGGYTRNDTWTSFRTGETFLEMRFSNGPDDDTPMYTGPYVAECSCCWLGFSHTVSSHESKSK